MTMKEHADVRAVLIDLECFLRGGHSHDRPLADRVRGWIQGLRAATSTHCETCGQLLPDRGTAQHSAEKT